MNNGVRIALLLTTLFCAIPGMARAQVVPPPPPLPTVTASAVATTTAHDTPVTIQFLGTTSSGTLIYSTTTDPVHGTLGTISGDTVVYTPDSGYIGTDTFTYKALSVPVSATSTVTITVTGTDTTAPIIVAPATQYFSTTTIPAFPTLVAATATDDTDPSPVITSNAPASFPVGTTTITWTATDASGNHASTTSDVGITQVSTYRVSNSTSSAETGTSFTVTALVFDGTSSYIPASGAVLGVVLSSSTSTIIATSTADAAGQATFTIASAGSYAVGLESDLYGTTAPITIIAPVIPTPAPTPTPIGNGPPVANPVPVYVPPPAPAPTEPAVSASTPVVAPAPAQISDAAPTPTPTPRTAEATTKKIAVVKPATLAVARPPVETPAPQADTQLAAAASAANGSTYEFLGLIIVLLALAGLIWQWKKRRERAQ